MNEPAFFAGRPGVASNAAAPVCPDTSPPSLPSEQASRLLPTVAYAPWQILLWAVIPQLLLLWCNSGNYQMIAGDIDPTARAHWLGVMAAGGALAVGFGVLSGVLWWRRGQIGGWGAMACMVPVIAFLNYALWNLANSIPRAAHWILPPETVIIQNLTGAAPALLYFGLILCSRPVRSVPSEIGTVVARAVAVGLGLALCFAPLGFDSSHWKITAGIGWSLAMLCCLLVVLRLLLLASRRLSSLSPMGLALLGMWIGLLLPMIGLWVNHWVPFPYDFQLPWIYAFTAVNGVLLSLPAPGNSLGRRALWLAQCFGLPFSLYFFVVFMPFMPLTAPGLIIWGGGLLVLAPTCVLLLHAFRVIDGFRRERDAREGQRLWLPALAGAAAFLMVPGGVVWRANMDRAALRGALDFVYVASPQDSPRFNGDPADLRRALEHVQAFKAGKRLPFLSALYDNMVFDGLMLPETKITELSRTFLGGELPEVNYDRRTLGGGFVGMRGARLSDPPHTNVAQLPVAASYRPDSVDEAFIRATVMVKIQNNRSQQGEFKTTLTLPENVAVSGFWLHIGDERVPGRMTEKKSAMWVYQMIRDVTRRDPGILRYTSPGQLELRVFPLGDHETRTVEVEFLAPVSIDEPVVIGGEHVALSDGSSQSDAGICMARSDSGASIAIASESFSQNLPSIRREPYLHVIVDRSIASQLSRDEIASAIESARGVVPHAVLGRATLANFEMLDVAPEPMALDILADTVGDAMGQLPRRGGFSAGRAMHRVLAQHASEFRFAQPGDFAFECYPVFMVLGAEHAVDLKAEHLSWLAALAPDVAAYHVMEESGSGWDVRAIGGRRAANGSSVHIFRIGNVNAILRAGGSAIAHVHGHGIGWRQPPLSVFDSQAKRFSSVTDARWIGAGFPYARALHLWRQQQMAIVDPGATGQGSLRELVVESRDSGILTNATAYIAVESHAQWKMLEAAEKKKLSARNGFEFAEAPPISSVPEPSTGLLVAVAGMILAWRRRR